MMAIKKKKATRKPKPPPDKAAVVVPPPVLTPKERRFWKVIKTQNLIGGTMFLMGVAFALGYIASDKAHLHEKVALYAAGIFMLAGSHFLSSEPTERFLKAAVNTVKGTRKEGDPPAGGA
jgi:outer membrane biosynthesis protein TonB